MDTVTGGVGASEKGSPTSPASPSTRPTRDRSLRASTAKRMRLDQLLVRRGLYPSRERAQRAVMAGLVRVEGERQDKPGTAVKEGCRVEVVAGGEPYVSRGGRKLEEALAHFAVDPDGVVCLDVGASTGGFTHCLLEHGAERVYALDVGYGQLDSRLRHDPRVVVMERCNARYLGPRDLPECCGLITVDVAFISLAKVVPALLPHLEPGGLLLPLVKPQFEAGRRAVGKGGVVRDETVRRAVIEGCAAQLESLGLERLGLHHCSLTGPAGNREAFVLLRRGAAGG